MLYRPRPGRDDPADVVPPPSPVQLTLALDGFEGPLDLLLDLARRQKVDLARLSITGLVDQYLAHVAAAQPRLELAADWLVMAAWLAYLKSRLLLPGAPEPEPDAAEEAERLKHRLARLDAMRAAAAALDRRPQLGRDRFARGAAEGLTVTLRRRATADWTALLAAYGALAARNGTRTYRPRTRAVLSIEAARQRLVDLIGDLPPWSELTRYLPPELDPALRRGAHATMLVAALELARAGRARLRQARPFGPIELMAA